MFFFALSIQKYIVINVDRNFVKKLSGYHAIVSSYLGGPVIPSIDTLDGIIGDTKLSHSYF